MYRLLCLAMACFLMVGVECVADAELEPSPQEGPTLQTVCSPTECYKITKELGNGFFGRVYAVENSKGQKFALKTYILEREEAFEGHMFLDIEREFSRGQLLDHPNIIKSYDFFTSTSQEQQVMHNLILDLVEGQTLFDTKRGSFSSEDAIHQTEQFCKALHYALSLGLMHLDLHSQNIMVSANSEIKIIDLASFTTFEEIRSFAMEKLEEAPQVAEEEANYNAQLKKQATKVSKEALKPLKRSKLNKFFLKHPHFLEKFKKKHRNIRAMKKHWVFEDSEEKTAIQSEKTVFDEIFIWTVTEACVDILLKSNLSREVKVNLCAEIKKLAWNQAEDIAEHKEDSADRYLYELTNLLEHFK